MSAQRESRGATSSKSGRQTVAKPKAATSKAAGSKASASKAPAVKPAAKTKKAPARATARTKASAAAKKAAPVKTVSGERPSGGFVKRGVHAFTRSYLVRFITVLAVVVAAVFIAASAFSAQSNAPVTQRADGLPVYITDEMIDTARAMQHEYGHPAGCTIAQIIQESGQGTTVTQRADGLPVYITDEMIDTARAMQHEYGHPAGCTIAQIIQESGQGTTLSMLAERDNNLFGMKWVDSFAGKHGVVGPVEWGTDEEYDGKTVAIKDAFIEFESKKACIEFRSSVFLQSSTYADNATIRRAIETRNSALMAWGLQDAGWATDSSYAEHLVAVMDRYDLYRFDS